jgi:hypothetical protein
MFVDFNNFLNTIKTNDIYDYFNCYSTALITRKDLKDNILTHRMNFLIDYYVSNLNNNIINKSELINYYLKNYKDDFDTSLSYKNKVIIKEEEDYDTDVRDHYFFITSKAPPKPEIDYDEIDKKFYLEEEEKKLEKENNYNDDDDYYDEYYEEEYDEDYYYLDEDEDY